MLHFSIYIFSLILINELWLGTGIDPDTALTPFPSSIARDRFEPTTFQSWIGGQYYASNLLRPQRETDNFFKCIARDRFEPQTFQCMFVDSKRCQPFLWSINQGQINYIADMGKCQGPTRRKGPTIVNNEEKGPTNVTH